MSKTKCVVALVAILGLTVTGPPAQAETRAKSDRAKDAPAKIDIRRVAYTYGDERIKVKAHVPDLGQAGRADLTITRFEVFEAGYVLRIVKQQGSAAKVRLYYFDHFDLNRRACDGLAGQWNDTGIRLAVPTDCLGGHARRQVRVQLATQFRQQFDRAPAVRRLARG